MRPLVTPIRTLVDGVPTFYADVDGPFVATLAFRAGRADERLPSAGVTHLLEHLAMPTGDIRGIEADASVGATWTLFWAQGPPDSVVEHMNAVARNLAQLPLERLETERKILLTEAAGRGVADTHRLAYMLRFGARSYGLVGYDEPGMHRLTAADISAWANARFTRGNAALWLTRPPTDLRLPLPDGDRPLQFPPSRSTIFASPASTRARPTASAVVGRATEHRAFARAAGSRSKAAALAPLRGRPDYSVDVIYEPLTADATHVAIAADALPENVTDARDRLLSAIRELAVDGPTDDELSREREELVREFADPHAAQARLTSPGRPSFWRPPS